MVKTHFTLQELAELTNSQLKGDPLFEISGVDTLEEASESDVSFLANPKYLEAMKGSSAGVICINADAPQDAGQNYLISVDPSRTLQHLVELLSANCKSGFEGIHSTAIIHDSAYIGKNVNIGPYVVIDQGVTIGDGTVIHAHVSIGAMTKIGSACTIFSQVAIRENCLIGDRVIIQPGAVIGSCGYGYTMNAKGHHQKLDQVGNVILEDDVEVGANTTIDRARFKSTRIGRGTKLDNLVQIGHNVTLGEDNLIISQSGIAGSAKTGRHVFMGGQGGIVGHVEIADNVQIATRGGVSKDIKESGVYGGGPVMPMRDFNLMQVHVRKLDTYVKRIKKLEELAHDHELQENG